MHTAPSTARKVCRCTGGSHRDDCKYWPGQTRWPGLDVDESALSVPQFLDRVNKEPDTGPDVEVTLGQIIQILKLAALIFGFAPSAIGGAASQILATLQNRGKS